MTATTRCAAVAERRALLTDSPWHERSRTQFLKRMAVGLESLQDVWRQLALPHVSIELPVTCIDEVGEASTRAHIETGCRLLQVDIEIEFLLHGNTSCEIRRINYRKRCPHSGR